jgi:hypothetical protein
MKNSILSSLTDEQLISGFRDLVIDDQERLVLRLDHILEMDRRKLFLEHASLWAYLIAEYGIEEWVAERFIRAARLLGRFPGIRRKLSLGSLNLSLLEYALGAAHREKLSDPELWELLEAISGMSCRAARREIAIRYPHSTELARDRVRPLTQDVSELRCVVENSVLETLEEVRGFLAHSHPKLSMGELIGLLATEYRERHHPEAKAKRAEARQARKQQKAAGDENTAQTRQLKKAAVDTAPSPTLPRVEESKSPFESPTLPRVEESKSPFESPTAPRAEDYKSPFESPTTPRANSSEERRHPSQTLTHQMILKLGYVCSYVDPMTEKRCQSTYRLDKDHVQAWADGGKTELRNLRWLCHSHHKRVSFLRFGESAKYFKPAMKFHQKAPSK